MREPLSPVPCRAPESGAHAAGVTTAASRGAPHASQREAVIIRASNLGLCSDPGLTSKANRLWTMVSPQLQLGGMCAFPLAFRWETAGLRAELWKLRTSSRVSDGGECALSSYEGPGAQIRPAWWGRHCSLPRGMLRLRQCPAAKWEDGTPSPAQRPQDRTRTL